MNSLLEAVAKSVCSTLDIVTALQRCRTILQDVAPLEGLFVGKHVRSEQRVVYLADVNRDGGRAMEDDIWVPGPYHEYMMSTMRPESRLWRPGDDFPAMRVVAGVVVPNNNSWIEVRLREDGEHLAVLGAYAAPGQDISELTRILLDVREPLALSVANQLMARGLLDFIPEAGSARPSPVSSDPLADKTLPMIWKSSAMHVVAQAAEQVALRPCTVLLLGETGVGKDVLARRIHDLSARRKGPFVHVNCGALPESLIDSELFGHERGAFTGATTRNKGLFEQADGGTIFLDEIGELPPQAQTRLLLVMEELAVRRVGGTGTVPVDFRVIAATNRDLEEMVQAGTFRRDLYYRLSGVSIRIPPLRERLEDIPVLAPYLLRRAAGRLGLINCPEISEDALCTMFDHPWPGNVRELASVLERSLILHPGNRLHLEMPTAGKVGGTGGGKTLTQGIREQITQALRQAGGRVSGPGGAAEILNINPSTLRSKMQKLGIPYGRRRTGAA
ncbi:sigma 54-interacting transcriptional regulator [Desulfovibrio aminophilus]|uniref:sigma-54 interaction domain-containing protein n=1 Tax=Desulfovibrio aminophilus TaxID=81425 RepID=UPI003399392A